VALCLYAVAPAQILMTSVLGTEIIYGALLVAATWATLRFVSWKGASTGGLLLGMSQYVRSTSLVLLPVLLAAAWMLGRPTPGSRRSHLDGLGRVTIMAIAFLVILLPVAAWNTQLLGWPSVSTSSFQNWELLLGTNQVYDGRFNAADVALVGGTPGTAEAEAIAGQLAWERIRDDPLGTAGLFARKFPQAWADEHYGARWALYESPGSNPVVVQAAVLLSQAWLAVLAVLAAIGFWSARRRPAPAMTATAALLLVYAIALMPLEANPRYHAPMVPLLCIPAAFGAVMLGAWWSASRRGT
jgi:Gpi18-like mannosyltransferase